MTTTAADEMTIAEQYTSVFASRVQNALDAAEANLDNRIEDLQNVAQKASERRYVAPFSDDYVNQYRAACETVDKLRTLRQLTDQGTDVKERLKVLAAAYAQTALRVSSAVTNATDMLREVDLRADAAVLRTLADADTAAWTHALAAAKNPDDVAEIARLYEELAVARDKRSRTKKNIEELDEQIASVSLQLTVTSTRVNQEATAKVLEAIGTRVGPGA